MDTTTVPTAAELIKKYIELRDTVDKLTLEFEASLDLYKQAMQTIEGIVTEQINRLGGQSIKTEYGTAYRSTTLQTKVADRDIWLNFIFEHNQRQFLTTNVNKEAIRDWLEAHANQGPPGLDITTVIKTSFRRPT
jgi:hypothetical protein